MINKLQIVVYRNQEITSVFNYSLESREINNVHHVQTKKKKKQNVLHNIIYDGTLHFSCCLESCKLATLQNEETDFDFWSGLKKEEARYFWFNSR